MRDLPTFYYHDHFVEFLKFIRNTCTHLLHPEHLKFLKEFDEATKDQQCLFIRCVNRKLPVINSKSLIFVELGDIQQLLSDLKQKGWLSEVTEKDKGRFINALTKDGLYDLANSPLIELTTSVKKSYPRQLLVEACHAISGRDICATDIAKEYVVRAKDDIIDYFLFLYFGNCRDRLNQFSMRDLGIMRTREEIAQVQSRFECKHQALSVFQLKHLRRELKTLPLQTANEILALYHSLPEAVGEQAELEKNKIAFLLANRLIEHDVLLALPLLKQIQHQDAQEKWCREAFKQGMKEQVEAQLLSIIDNPISDHLAFFAEDFLARKYQQKRTSLMTDMLRQGNRHLVIDEIYKGSVEKGVITHYQNQGLLAFRTENNLWRALFCLILWEEIFDTPGMGLATEFDYMPESLKQNKLYESAGTQIENTLVHLTSGEAWINAVVRSLAKHAHKPQSLYSATPTLIEELKYLTQLSDPLGLQGILLRMAKDWHGTKDGFPDITVVENNQIRFEEIKGEGDALRRNQLLRIQQLRELGFEVQITTAEFAIDPMQPYVVVDIETTGGRANQHKITEIGMVKIINGEVVDQWQSLINPQRKISKFITQLTGIDDEMVSEAPVFEEVADQIENFTKNSIFVAHNVNFDYGFIREEFNRIERIWRRPKLCTVQQMRKYFKGLESYSLANLTKHFDISMQRHHRAMSDAMAASELLNLVNEKRLQLQNQAH
ncbi:exonuclease domain-containing protein [Glaciecola sp. 1036]|uniref:exonuclease domain-containing protein n=1 Tax=Alteromonadaceae TaxID=72275 RepID=UPI003D0870CD